MRRPWAEHKIIKFIHGAGAHCQTKRSKFKVASSILPYYIYMDRGISNEAEGLELNWI